MGSLSGQCAVVTGAASGIGRATALALARRGAQLFLCDIDEGGLAQAGSQALAAGTPRVETFLVDVSQRAQMADFADAIHARVDAIDILVNNAGVALGGALVDTSIEDWEWLLGINLWGVIYGLHFFVPAMVAARRGGHIVNISSVAGLVGIDHLSAYSASKFALVGISESLSEELRPHDIGVTVVCPGMINTPIVHKSRNRGLMANPTIQRRTIETFRRRNYSPHRVAHHIVRAIQAKRHLLPVTPEAHVIYGLKRYWPGLLRHVSRLIRRRALAGISL